MNREVHYIFSIQTQDYLKSAWERGRRVYLMISPIAQCRADASGNFRKAVARGDRTAVSCLSNLQNMKGLIKRKPGTTTTTTMSCAHFLNFQLQRAWCNRLNNNRSFSRRSSCWIGKRHTLQPLFHFLKLCKHRSAQMKHATYSSSHFRKYSYTLTFVFKE